MNKKYNADIIKGAGYVLAYVFLSIFNELASYNGVKNLHLHPIQMIFCRFFFSTISILPFLIAMTSEDILFSKSTHSTTFMQSIFDFFKNRVFHNLYTSFLTMHILRALSLGIGMLAYINAYHASQISMSLNVIGGSLTPLCSSILACIIFKDKIKMHLPFFALSFIGIMLALSTHFTLINIYATRFILISIFFYGITDILNKFSLNHKEPIFRIMFYTNLIISLLAFPFAYHVWQSITLHQCFIFMCVGINGNIISYCLIKSLKYTFVATLQPLKYIKLPLIFLCDQKILHHSISIQIWIGFGLILLSSILSTYTHAKHKRNQINCD